MKMEKSVQIRGLIRFSYMSDGGFRLNKDAKDDLAQALFDAERMRWRMELFRRFTLPSLIAQRDQEFRVAVLVSDQMPDPFRIELEGLLAPHAFARIVALPPMQHYDATKAAFALIPLEDESSHLATFRLDDDDAIHVDMISRIRKLANGLLLIRDDDRPFFIGFMRGYFLSIEDGQAVVSRVTERTPLGIGLTMVTPRGSTDNVFLKNNHRAIAEDYDLFTEARRPMFIRTVHDHNDSGAINSGKMRALRSKQDWNVFHRSFEIDLEGVELHSIFNL